MKCSRVGAGVADRPHPLRSAPLSTLLFLGIALVLGAAGCRRLTPAEPVPGAPTASAAAASPEQALVALWDRVLHGDASSRNNPSLESLGWEPVRVGMDVQAPAIILTSREASVVLATPAGSFLPAFLDMVRGGGTLGYRLEGDSVALDIPGGMLYTLDHRRDAHGTGVQVVGRVTRVEGLAVVATDHERIRRDFAGVAQQSLASKAPAHPGARRKGLGVAGRSVADLPPHDPVVSMLGKRAGIQVGSVYPGSPAARAGLQVGDVLLRFGDVAVDDWRSLKACLDSTPQGRPVTVVVFRPGAASQVTLTVTLGEFEVVASPSPVPAPTVSPR